MKEKKGGRFLEGLQYENKGNTQADFTVPMQTGKKSRGQPVLRLHSAELWNRHSAQDETGTGHFYHTDGVWNGASSQRRRSLYCGWRLCLPCRSGAHHALYRVEPAKDIDFREEGERLK